MDLRDLLYDVRHAGRRLRRRPGFTVTALVTIALGIGAVTALFSVVEAVLLRPLPWSDPEGVAVLWDPRHPDEETALSAREIVEYRGAARGFAQIAAYTETATNLTGGSEPERVAAAAVTANTFATLGVQPVLGRPFTRAEEVPGEHRVALLGHDLWRRRFGGDPAVVGRRAELDGRPHTVVGVMPPGFHLPLEPREGRVAEIWLPLALGPEDLEAWGDRYLTGFGRLAPGVTPERASAELATIGRGWIAAGVVADQGDRRMERAALPAQELLTRRVRPALAVLMATGGLLLLIACVNVTNLLLAAAEERRREAAVRLAVGAGRARLIGQLLAESLVLALAGGAGGLGLACGAVRLLVAHGPAGIPRLTDSGLDLRVFLFALAAVLGSGLVFGLVPALQASRADLAGALQEGARSGTPGRRGQRFSRGLVAFETALSVALLVGAGLLLRSFWRLQRVDLGLEPQRVLTARLSLPEADYPRAGDITGFLDRLLGEVRALPGVESAAAVRLLPLTGEIGDWSITLESRPHDPRENPNGDWQVATPGYIETLGLRLLRGRSLAAADRADAPPVAVVNRTMAARYWPGEDLGAALGQRFRLGTAPGRPWFSVVGIVEDVHHNAVAEAGRAEMILPLEQFQAATGSPRRGLTLVVRSAAPAAALASDLRRTVQRLAPGLPLADVRPMEEVVASALARPRFTAHLLALFAALALLLAAIGLYGVLAHAVARRRQEIGIRVTLGASRARVLRLVLADGLALAGAGIALGLLLALALAPLLAGQLYGVTPHDLPTFAAVPALLAAVALAATWLPARRAAAVDPLAALRQR
jgi:putative ABC transport system permease protein